MNKLESLLDAYDRGSGGVGYTDIEDYNNQRFGPLLEAVRGHRERRLAENPEHSCCLCRGLKHSEENE